MSDGEEPAAGERTAARPPRRSAGGPRAESVLEVVPNHAKRRRGCGNAERDDRRGDAVIESALDVEHPPDTAGSRSSAITDALRAASVGARLAVIRPAKASGRLGNTSTAMAVPATIDSGSPIANNRDVKDRSWRAAAGGTPEASANSSAAR